MYYVYSRRKGIIPGVLAAVFLTGFFIAPINTLVWPSVTALILLIIFVVLGSGPVSLDNFLAGEQDAD